MLVPKDPMTQFPQYTPCVSFLPFQLFKQAQPLELQARFSRALLSEDICSAASEVDAMAFDAIRTTKRWIERSCMVGFEIEP
jgi:hypothetical protein